VSVALSSGAQAAPHRANAVAKTPPGISGEIIAIVGVPHSSKAFAVDSHGSAGNGKYVILRRSGQHWVRTKLPKLGGRYGSLSSLGAASAKTIWLSGAVQGTGIQETPALWRWNGHSFARVKLPAMEEGAASAGQISASSPTNAWVAGSMWDSGDNQSALHLVGKKWTAVEYPPDSELDVGMTSVATVGPKFAWGLRADQAILYWAGTAWAAGPAIPAGVSLLQIAASTKAAYAVGETTTGNPHPVILKWTGRAWARVKLPKHTPSGGLNWVGISGKSAWAVGDYNSPIILHTTGGAWKLQHVKGKVEVDSLSVSSPKRAYIGGTVVNQTTRTAKTFIAEYNGHAWKPLPS
jgi:hypothetical protein